MTKEEVVGRLMAIAAKLDKMSKMRWYEDADRALHGAMELADLASWVSAGVPGSIERAAEIVKRWDDDGIEGATDRVMAMGDELGKEWGGWQIK